MENLENNKNCAPDDSPARQPTFNRSPQGYKKFIEYIEVLRRNEYFKKDFNKICGLFNKKTGAQKRDRAIFNFCKKYHIDWGIFEGFGYIKNNERFDWGWMFPNFYNRDMCILKDVYGTSYKKWLIKEGKKMRLRSLDPKDYFTSTKNMDLVDRSFEQLYPVAIYVHQFSSKRDVLDYIEKEWNEVEHLLSFYRNKSYKPKRRKFGWRLIDCIWDNRVLPAKKIKGIINEKFPKNDLGYEEILKIKSLEKKKRNRKIT
jgi:hypothetical protein